MTILVEHPPAGRAASPAPAGGMLLANLPPSATGGSAHSPGRFGRVAQRIPGPASGPAASP